MLSCHRRAIGYVLVCLMLTSPGCVNYIRKIDAHEERLAALHAHQAQMARALNEVRQTQADMQATMDQLRGAVQRAQGAAEESAHQTTVRMAALDERLTAIEGTVANLDAKVARPVPAPQTKPAAVPEPVDPARALYDRAQAAYRGKQYAQARQLLLQFQQQFPDHELVDNALFWIGVTFFQEKAYKRAIDAFETTIAQSPGGNKTPDAYYYQALCFAALEDRMAARLLLETVLEQFPDAAIAPRAKTQLAKMKK